MASYVGTDPTAAPVGPANPATGVIEMPYPTQYAGAQSQPATANDEGRYILIVRQQPKQARFSGISDRAVDRRPLDPLPILQLILEDPVSKARNKTFLHNPFYFAYATLINPDTHEEINMLKDSNSRAITGSIASSLYRLKDIDNSYGGFFVFPDISVRLEGRFRLRFTLFEIVGNEVIRRKSINSDIFTVYAPKAFPGMTESTPLSRFFAEQGLKIRIRKEMRVGRRGRQTKRAIEEEQEETGREKKRRSVSDGSDDESPRSATKQQQPGFYPPPYDPYAADPRMRYDERKAVPPPMYGGYDWHMVRPPHDPHMAYGQPPMGYYHPPPGYWPPPPDRTGVRGMHPGVPPHHAAPPYHHPYAPPTHHPHHMAPPAPHMVPSGPHVMPPSPHHQMQPHQAGAPPHAGAMPVPSTASPVHGALPGAVPTAPDHNRANGATFDAVYGQHSRQSGTQMPASAPQGQNGTPQRHEYVTNASGTSPQTQSADPSLAANSTGAGTQPQQQTNVNNAAAGLASNPSTNTASSNNMPTSQNATQSATNGSFDLPPIKNNQGLDFANHHQQQQQQQQQQQPQQAVQGQQQPTSSIPSQTLQQQQHSPYRVAHGSETSLASQTVTSVTPNAASTTAIKVSPGSAAPNQPQGQQQLQPQQPGQQPLMLTHQVPQVGSLHQHDPRRMAYYDPRLGQAPPPHGAAPPPPTGYYPPPDYARANLNNPAAVAAAAGYLSTPPPPMPPYAGMPGVAGQPAGTTNAAAAAVYARIPPTDGSLNPSVFPARGF